MTGASDRALSPADALADDGLLDATTVLAGVRRGWMTAPEVTAWALERLMADDDPVDPDLVRLTSAEGLHRADLNDLLEVFAAREATPAAAAHQRWMLGGLLALRSEPLSDEERFDRLDELYADLGHPEELRWCGQYNFTDEELASGVEKSPLDSADEAIVALRASLGGDT